MNSAEQIRQTITALESRFEPGKVNELEQAVSGLAEDLKDDRPAVTIMKMMMSMCAYLESRKEDAHPDTLPVLAGLANDLDRLLTDPRPLQEDCRQILQQSHNAFKALKHAIATAPFLSDGEMEELKAVILSVDWEISDRTLRSFDTVITRLKDKLKANKVHFTFLQIMHSIGVYVARNKASSHKDAIKLLRSVFGNYEEVSRNSGMSAEKKKQILEGDIRAYNAFKREIGRSVQPLPESSVRDQEMPPALSHLRSSAPDRDSAPLSTLQEPSGEEKLAPRVSQGKTGNIAPPAASETRDVMGDLFSPKASPADELLDAIHMAELHGAGPGQDMRDAPDSDQTRNGIKNFTPERGDATPIPEIETRLDEFFNLDVSERQNETLPVHDEGVADGDAPPATPPEVVPEDAAEPELPEAPLPDDGIEDIIPFQYEDESVPEYEESNMRTDDIMERLQTTVGAPADLKDESVFQNFSGDLTQLKGVWADDVEKNTLIDMMTGLAQHIHSPEPSGEEEEGPEPDTAAQPEPETEGSSQIQAPPKGLWAKIKSMFKN